MFHEGLRVPPVKIKKRGEDNVEVWKLLLANVRTPRVNYEDLRALIARGLLGESRAVQVIKKYGKTIFRETVHDLLDYSDRRMQSELESIPDGIYSFEDYIESDGVDADRTYAIKVEVHKFGGSIVIDYDGSSRQAKGPINATLGVATSAAYNAVLHMTDPSIPRNSGCFGPIRVLAPPGKSVNVDYPGPEVGGILKLIRVSSGRLWAPWPMQSPTGPWRRKVARIPISFLGESMLTQAIFSSATTLRV